MASELCAVDGFAWPGNWHERIWGSKTLRHSSDRHFERLKKILVELRIPHRRADIEVTVPCHGACAKPGTFQAIHSVGVVVDFPFGGFDLQTHLRDTNQTGRVSWRITHRTHIRIASRGKRSRRSRRTWKRASTSSSSTPGAALM